MYLPFVARFVILVSSSSEKCLEGDINFFLKRSSTSQKRDMCLSTEISEQYETNVVSVDIALQESEQ